MKIDIKGTICANDDAEIYKWYGIEHTTPKNVISALNDATGDVDIYINSGGGDVFAATEIYSAIQQSERTVNIHVVGLAASAATIIMCAGHCDITAPSVVMIHNASTYANGDKNVMYKTGNTLEQINKAICSAYTAKTGKSEADFLELMDNESWLTSAQAVELGLCDEVVGKETVTNGFCRIITDRERLEFAEHQKQTALDKLKIERLRNKGVSE